MSENQEAQGIGHNSEAVGSLTEALLISHFSKLRAQQLKVDAKKIELDAERSAMTDLFRLAKVDGLTRKELTTLLDDSKSSQRDLQREEERRAQLRSWIGLPAGTQTDLFARLPEEVKDEQYYEGQGYAAGLRGDSGVAPEEISPRFIQAWLRGWSGGQEKLAWALAEAGRNPEKKDTGVPTRKVELEPEDGEDVFDPDAAARELQAAGFLEPSGEGDDEDPPIPGLSEVFPGAESEAAEEKSAKRSRRRSAAAVH